MSFDGGNGILYLVATGGEPAVAKIAGNNPAIVLISVLGAQPPPHVLGEPSAGEAMGLGSPPFPLTEHLSISVPNAETRNPYTGTNWEGTGVIPDVSVSATAALLAAYKRALHASDDRYDPMNELPTALQDPAAALRASFPAVSP
jgi:hypothetical protein